MPHASTALRRPRRLHDAAVRRPAGFSAAMRVDPWQTGHHSGTVSFLVEDDDDTTLPWLTCQRDVAIGNRRRAVRLQADAALGR